MNVLAYSGRLHFEQMADIAEHALDLADIISISVTCLPVKKEIMDS